MNLVNLCKKLHPQRVAAVNISSLEAEIVDTPLVIIHKILTLVVKKITVKNNSINSSLLYCLGITNSIPSRPLKRTGGSFPDIDMDFCEKRRGEVIEYVENKYGKDKVAHIGTYGSMKSKASIKDVARALGVSYDTSQKLAKLTLDPIEGKPQSLKTCYEKVPELHNLRLGNSEESRVLQWAERVENRLRSFGTHASGVVISDKPINESIPLYPGKDGTLTTQFEMNTVEEIGLIKFDFLGLRALTTIQRCVDMIKERHDETIDPLQIPIDDKKTYKLLQDGDIGGVFQLEGSGGIRDLLVQIRPTCLEDIAILVALYRPGPLGCLSGDTKILTRISKGKRKNFSYTTIKELYDSYQKKQSGQTTINKRKIWSINESTHQLVSNKINKVFFSGFREVFRLKIQTGLSKTQQNHIPSVSHSQRKTNDILCTKDHLFFTLKGWKKLEDINFGEYIAITHHSCFGVSRSKNSIYGKRNFANIAFRHYQYKCVFCNWNDGSLDVNHVDGNQHIDNSPKNLSFLCPNHHRMYSEESISKDELLSARQKCTLPYTDQIMFVRYLGKDSLGTQDTYDIEVEGPNHNFIAGDFVVHNSSELPHYLKVRAGETTPNYLDDKFEPILGATDGMLVYQEQILEICKQLAGYTMGEADLMRRAVGKKKKNLMDIEHPKFMKGMAKSGFTKEVAKTIWEEIEVFAGYGFNKSVDKDTLVNTMKGPKKIKDFRGGEEIISIDREGFEVINQVKCLHDHGKVPMWEVEFDDKTIEKCTLDHKWLTEEGQQPLWRILQEDLSVLGDKTTKEWNKFDDNQEISVWSGDKNSSVSSKRTSPELYSMPTNSKENSPRDKNKIQQVISYSKDCFGYCKNYICKTRNTKTKNSSTKTLARQVSREICFDQGQGSCIPKVFQDGTVARTKTEVARIIREKCSTTVWDKQKTSRFCKPSEGLGSRSRWTMAFSTGEWRKETQDSQIQRQDIRERDNSTRVDLGTTQHGKLQILWRTYKDLIRSNHENIYYQGKRNLQDRKIIRIKYLGLRQSYDLEVYHQSHNFLLASGLCCSNSHAVCYGYVSYQMAYLKAHYPLEFMCSCLISDSDEADKIIKYIGQCKYMGIDILPPSINESGYEFKITKDDKSVRFGLGTIKNLGKPMKDIITEREENGNFKNIIDFADRVDLSKINRRKLESLVLAGAFDDTGDKNRASLMGAVEDIYRHKEEIKRYLSKYITWEKKTEFHKERQIAIEAWAALTKEEQKAARADGQKKPGQVKVPTQPELPTDRVVPDIEEIPIQEKLANEKELMGFYVSGHPLDHVKEWSRSSISLIKDAGRHRQKTQLIAVPIVIKEITTKKKKQRMAYMVLEDKTGTMDAVILPKPFGIYKNLLDTKIPAKYDVSIDIIEGDETNIAKLVINKIYPLESLKEIVNHELRITVPLESANLIAKRIKSQSGNQTNVDLFVKSDAGNVWKLGSFQCTGTKQELEEGIKDLL